MFKNFSFVFLSFVLMSFVNFSLDNYKIHMYSFLCIFLHLLFCIVFSFAITFISAFKNIIPFVYTFLHLSFLKYSSVSFLLLLT